MMTERETEVAREREAFIQQLQDALFFWLPNVPPEFSARAERMTKDAYLLTGRVSMTDDTAEEFGWIIVPPEAPVTETRRVSDTFGGYWYDRD